MHHSFRPWRPGRFPGLMAALLATVALSAPVRAADPPPAAPPAAPGQAMTAEDLAKSAEEMARSAGEVAKSVGGAVGGAIGSLWNDVTSKIAPGPPTDHLPAQISEEDKQFFAILETIGLQLKDVNVSKGLIPSASYRFVAAREPADTDIAKAEALLRAYRDGNDGMRARAKQRIARSTLDTMATAGVVLSGMDVTLSPWPDASYQIANKPKAETSKP